MDILNVVRELDNRIYDLICRLQEISAMLEKSTSRADVLPGGSSGDRIGRLVAKKIELERELDYLNEICAECTYELTMLIAANCISETVQAVLYRRNCLLERYDEIAAALKISVRQVYRLHKVGVKELESKIF